MGSTKEQHLYMIGDADGNIKKIGVSGQPLNILLHLKKDKTELERFKFRGGVKIAE